MDEKEKRMRNTTHMELFSIFISMRKDEKLFSDQEKEPH